MNIVGLSIRNSGRNLQRTLVTTLAMAFACFIMIIFSGIMEGMIQGSERQVVEMNMGDIQIHQPGYIDDPDIYTTIPDAEAIVRMLQEMGLQASPRLYAYGLLAANLASAGVEVRGIHLQTEKLVTKLHQHIGQGSWLDSKRSHHVVLGKKLASTLGVSLGDELIFVGQTADGFMANDIYYVQGILKSVSDGIDRTGLFMLDQTFRELMALRSGSHEIVVVRPDRSSDIELVTQQIQTLLPSYEVKNWRQLLPFISKMLESADAQMLIMLGITYIAVASIILNAMLMTVFERMHEFGIMKAVGVRPWQIVALIYSETMIQALVASVIALISGWWASDYLQLHGIDMSSFMSGSISLGDIAFDPIWYSYVTPASISVPIIFLLLIAALSVIYPASKAALIKPIDAIYYR